MRIRLAVLEKDQNYASRLIRYFTTYYINKIEAFAFSDLEAFQESLQQFKIDVLLASPELVPEGTKFPKTIIMAYLSESTQIQSINNVKAVCKYQKAELLYREILGLYAELDRKTAYRETEGACPLFLFMGASGGVGTTTMSVACALRLASFGKHVLYLNLEENGVISPFLKGDGNSTLSDVLYAVKSSPSNLVLKLERMVRKSEQGIYFYEPFSITLDAYEMTENELKDIITTLIGDDSYEYVIVDTGSSVSWKRNLIIKYAREVFIVGDGSEISNGKLEKLLQELSIKDEHEEERAMAKVQVLYNRFTEVSQRANTKYQERVYGSISRIRKSTPGQIAEDISQNSFFDRLLK